MNVPGKSASGSDGVTVAPYGTWQSPIDAAQLAAGSTPLAAPRIAGDTLYWLEGLSAEQGRVVVVRQRPGEPPRRLTPAPCNVRSRVHEYGGGAYAVAGESVWFSNFADNLVYLQQGDAPPVALTGNGAHRHADFEPDAARHRLIAVREDHCAGDHAPVNSLVSLPSRPGEHDERVLVQGHDFFAAPRLSPDGRQLAWLCWDHPRMPWNGTELWLADVADDGALARTRRLAGGPDESLCQPTWSPDGRLHVVSDRSGWWNLYEVGPSGDLAPVAPMAAEFGRPQWIFGQSMYGFASPRTLWATCIEQGRSRLLRLVREPGGQPAWQDIDTPFTDIGELRVGPGILLALAGAADRPESVVRLTLDGDHLQHETVARSVDSLPPAHCLSTPQAIVYPSADGRRAHAFFYAPRHGGFEAPAGERPPLIVTSHGGPTSMSTRTLRLAIQYWTSRGFAVLDVNYGGSSGYGRPYRDLLAGRWGIVDVEDCVAGARWLAGQDLVDPRRMAIRGSSASGFTTLCALTFHSVFKAGASYYGVSDLAALDADTHKFEAHYTTWLVAPPATRERIYAERSPAQHADRLSCPMIFFQGNDDKVVPPAQSQRMVDALKRRGIPVAYLSFDGEGHGFRRADTVRRTLEAELAFYATVFGFQAAGPLPPVDFA